MAKEGYPFLLTSIVLTLIAYWIWPYLAVPFGLFTLFTAYFFRDPERTAPLDKQLLVSPADGKIVEVAQRSQNPFVEGKVTRVGIFMSPFNVHVNRAPTRGIVKDVRYFPGKYLMAMKDKASEDNERNAVIMECDEGKTRIAFVQIAGFIARRILCYVKAGDKLEKGERFGIIRFGSRVDVYLPESMDIQIKMGEVVKAGETVLAKFPSPVPSPHRGEGGGEG